MSAARCEVVVAVEDRQALAIQQSALAERVERTFEQLLVPPVEEITGDDDVLGRLHRRRVELPPERVQITRVSQVQVGKMAQHTDGTARITSTNDRGGQSMRSARLQLGFETRIVRGHHPFIIIVV